MEKNRKSMLLLVLALLLVAGGVFLGANCRKWSGDDPEGDTGQGKQQTEAGARDWQGEQEVYTGKKNENTIDIPGFDVMNLKAGEKEQKVNLYNPEQNTCYFKMTLSLSDGTKLWESGLVEPGKGLYDITLDEAPEAGTYENALLKYECFTYDKNQSPLNGAEIKLTLNVLE